MDNARKEKLIWKMIRILDIVALDDDFLFSRMTTVLEVVLAEMEWRPEIEALNKRADEAVDELLSCTERNEIDHTDEIETIRALQILLPAPPKE